MLYRRPAPSILFTALAATVVMLPWAISGGPDGDDSPAMPAPQLAQQPLTDLGGGESIRELHQDTPFSLVALTSEDFAGTSARVRAKKDDGSWGPWYEAEPLEGVGADLPGPRGTEPVFVGRTTTVQVAVTRPSDAPPIGPAAAAHKPDVPALGYIPANVELPLPQNITAVLISPPQAPPDLVPLPNAATPAGQPPRIINRAEWGADEGMRCGEPRYDTRIRAGVVHHTAGSNEYTPEDSAGIVRSIYEYHTRTLGWCDIAYNAMVDKYGQVFEGRAGGMNRPVEGAHTGGFNHNTWGVAMLGNFDVVPPTPIQLRNTATLLGWVLGQAGVDPLATVVMPSEGGSFTKFPFGASPTLPTIFTHRDVGNTECPGNAAYALMGQIRDIAARFNDPPGPEQLAETLRGGAIHAKWESLGGMNSYLGRPTSPEASGEGATRYVTFEHGAVYWSPESGAEPVTGELYNAWGSLGFERGALGLPTSAEIPEPLWIVQNFQHGTLNFDRETGAVTRVIDGVPVELPPPGADSTPVQLERFTPPSNPA
ncbi:N-acetylmuramoyl-L-alanine amidase [Mycolicibacterium austroafricanum]|uniref:N-acetylmuramoyl-L-alanine amidase n=1 Tax=Mycolicibacterium austroafricanum TaxID=39687 RepID=UPI001ABFD78B|nr:N-acetylmuramoyl-L-alanine amidase [Mycolicibacterium austroafricanum]QRZ06706.1 LGFP repeat-containing protein [Mycolicibacterium austroafricanum]QZT68190.1 N-acetylmuramoyl-L-alanine amidase [Mycolicibacterium austroafricanum]